MVPKDWNPTEPGNSQERVWLGKITHPKEWSITQLGGLTSTETGEAMGISAGAVRFHLHEARVRLRERLEVRHD